MADDTVQPAPDSAPEPADAAQHEPAQQDSTDQEHGQEQEHNQEPILAAEPPGAEAPPLEVPPEPAPEAEPAQAIAATLEVPPLAASQAPGGAGGEGGEWDLLVSKLGTWLASGQLQQIWQQTRLPLMALATLVGVVLLLRLYGALLGAIEGLPLVPGLLELVGLIWLLRHGAPKLVRSQDRQQLITGLKQRWRAFRGQA